MNGEVTVGQALELGSNAHKSGKVQEADRCQPRVEIDIQVLFQSNCFLQGYFGLGVQLQPSRRE